MNSFLMALELNGIYAISAAMAIGLAAVAGAISMAIVIARALDAIARQPEADGKIKSGLILGLVFIETAIIFALIISILIVINVL